jgi:hypothetical protein
MIHTTNLKNKYSSIITTLFCLTISFALLNQLIFQSESWFSLTKLSGLGMRMNPYNSPRAYTREEIYAITNQAERIRILPTELYPSIFPIFLKGSFKYFYKEKKSKEAFSQKVAVTFCHFIENRINKKLNHLEIQIQHVTTIELKEYKCS